MAKVIVFGTGTILERYKSKINIAEIDAFVDNALQKQGQILWGKPVITPQDIKKRVFDYVVIFSTEYFKAIYHQLLYELAIPIEKILDFRTYVEHSGYEMLQKYEQVQALGQTLKRLDLKSLLDVDLLFSGPYFLGKESKRLFGRQPINLDGCVTRSIFPLYKNMYCNIVKDFTKLDKRYDMILFSDWQRFNSWRDYSEAIKRTKEYSRYVAFCLPFPYKKHLQTFCYPYSCFGKLQRIAINERFYLLVIDKAVKSTPLDLGLFVVTHKAFVPPVEEGYIPIHAGKAGNASLGLMSDDTGDHISRLNPYINECTALYWMWKQVKSKYIGLCHYRRYFLKNEVVSRENIMDKATIYEILQSHDIILANEHFCYPYTVGELIKHDTNEDLYDQAYKLIGSLIAKRQPEYVEAFHSVMSGYTFFKCNMFITTREIMNQYCQWLFSFLLDAAQTLDVNDQKSYEQRMVGFFAERMLTVWLMRQELKIKQMPIIEIS